MNNKIQEITEDAWTIVPNLLSFIGKIHKYETKIEANYMTIQRNLEIGKTKTKYELPEGNISSQELTIDDLKATYEKHTFGPTFFRSYAKLIKVVLQLKRKVRQYQLPITYTNTLGKSVCLHISSQNRQQYIRIQRKSGSRKTIKIDIKQFTKWYERQREKTINAQESEFLTLEQLEEEWESNSETLSSVVNAIDQVLGAIYIQLENKSDRKELTSSNLLSQYVTNKENLPWEPRRFIWRLKAFVNNAQHVLELTEERESHDEREWLRTMNYDASCMIEGAEILQPMLFHLYEDLIGDERDNTTA